MADLNFPTSPTLYQQYTLNGQTFVWDGKRWKFTSSSVVTINAGTAITSINNLITSEQFFNTGDQGSLFNISSSGSTHTFNIPIAGTASTGLVSTVSQSFAGQKTFTSAIIGDLIGTATTAGYAITAVYSNQSGYAITSGTADTSTYAHQAGYAITSGSSSTATTATYAHQSGYATTSGFAATSNYSNQSGFAITSGSSNTSGFATTANYANQSGYAITSGSSNTSGYATTSGFATTANYSNQSGYAITSGLATTANYSHQSGYGITAGFATSSTSASIATTAYSVSVNAASTNSSHYLIFSSNATGSGVALSTESALVYNPFTDILSVSGLAVTSPTISTSSSSGALIVTGGLGVGSTSYFNTDVNIGNSTRGRLFFSQATLGSAGTTVIPSMAFIGTTNSPITLSVLPDNSLSFDGSSGQLFSINNNLSTGWIFSINDISGLPIFRANADLTVSMGEYGGNTGIGLSNPSYKLHVAGDTNLSSGYVYRINGAYVLSSSSLGTGVTNSSLTALGIISTGTWSGSLITAFYGGTGYNSYTKGDILVGAGNTFVKLNAGTDNFVLTASSSSASGLTWSPTSATGITTLNSISTSFQYFATGYSGNEFNISSSGQTHTFNIPLAGTASTGLVSIGAQSFAGNKTFTGDVLITSSTASSNTFTGALRVNGGLGVSGQLSFGRASFGYTGINYNPSMSFIGNTSSSPITLSVLTDNSLSFEGSSGQLFGIDNNLSTGEIFSVSDISGLPIISASAGQTITLNEFGGITRIGNGSLSSVSSTSGTLVVYGGVGIGGSLYVASATAISGVTINNGVITGNLTGTASTATYAHQSGYGLTSEFATTANYAHQAGYAITSGSSGLATTATYSHQSGYAITSGFATTASYAYQSGYAITSGSSSTSGLATTATYSHQSGYAITSGLATSSTSIFINNATANSNHPIVFTPISGSISGAGLSTNSTVSYNPSANYLYTSGLAITASTASTSVSTGALIVNGGVGISGNLSYNSALIGNTGVASPPTMTFIGTNGDPVKLRVLDDSTLAFSGSQGQLFSISPVLNIGYIFSVNDISGVPLLRANADATVSMAEFAGNVGIGLSNPAYKLQVLGSAGISGTTYVYNTTSSISTSTGAFTVAGGVGIGGSLYVGSASNISGVILNSGIIYGTLVGSATSSGLATTANYSHESGYAITSGSSGLATTSTYSHQSGYAITSGSSTTSGLATTATYSHQSGYATTSGLATTANYASIANTSANINVVSATTSANHPILFTPASGTASGAAVSSKPTFVYNPSTDILSVSGLAITSGTASTSPTTGALVVTGGAGIGGSLFVGGDLIINGTTTTINSVTLTVDDKNIELGSVSSPSDVTAEGGGITLKGATDKSINWYTGTGWSSSESFNIASGNTYKINNTAVLSASSLGTGVTNSSLTALGTVTTGVWAGTAITGLYGGTGYNSYTKGDLLVGAGNTFIKFAVGSDNYVLTASSSSATGLTWSPTAATGITSLNGLSSSIQYFSIGYSGTVPSFSSFGSTHTLNIPIAGTGATGLINDSAQTIAGQKTFTSAIIGNLTGSATTAGFATTANYSNSSGFAITSGSSGLATTATYAHQSGYGITAGFATSSTSASIATTAYSVSVNAASTNSSHYLIISPSASGSGVALSTESALVYNPSTDILSVSGLAVTSGTSSTSTTTGALVVSGGVGIGQTLFTSSSYASSVSGVILNNGAITNTGTITSTGVMSLSNSSTTALSIKDGSNNTKFNVDTVGGIVSVSSSTTSTSTTTGALTVTGGVGIGNTLYVAGRVDASNYKAWVENRTLSSVDTCVGIGTFFIDNGAHNILISLNVSDGGYSVAKNYTLTSNWNLGGWSIVAPLCSTGAYGNNPAINFQLEAYQGSGSLTLRARSLGTSGNLKIYVQNVGQNTATFTAYNSATSETAISSYHPYAFASQENNVFKINSSTASTSTSTGAMVVTGGVGIGGSLYVNSASSISGVVLSSGVITGNLTGTATTATYSHQSGYAITSGSSVTSGLATTATYSHQSGYAITSESSNTSGYATTSGFASTASYSHQSGFAITSGFATTSGLATTATYAHQSGFAQTATLASTATTATNATNVILAADTTNASRRLIYSTNGIGSTSLYNTSTLFANPSASSIGASVFTNTGSVNIRPGIDATNGVSIGNSSGASFVYFDTINGRIGINQANPLYDLHITGELSATNKSFVIDHPTKPNMTLRHGSLEGPENGVYVRGKLVNENIIELPDYWLGLVDEETITVSLTPIGKFSKMYVEKIENYKVYVNVETGIVNCHFVVYGERKDIPKLDVEY
jgi:hypothetical protein